MNKVKRLLAATILAAVLSGTAYAQEETELMTWVKNLPVEISGNTLKMIANDLARTKHFTEAVYCYQMGIARNVAIQQERDKVLAKDHEMEFFVISDVYRKAPPEIQKYIYEFAIANATSNTVKKIQQTLRIK